MHHSANGSEAFEKFEEISALVKKTKLRFEDPQLDSSVNAPKKVNAAAARYTENTKKRKNLLNGVSKGKQLVTQIMFRFNLE